MPTWKPKQIGDTTPWQEPPPPEQREWRTAADYESNHRHSRDWGEQATSAIVEWSCGCGARQYEYDPAPHPVHAVDYGEPVGFEYAEAARTASAPQTFRSGPSGCVPWLLLVVFVAVLVAVLHGLT